MAATCTAYHPSKPDTQRYWETQSVSERKDVRIPKGFPESLVSTLAWTGDEIRSHVESAWKFDLTEDDVATIKAAVTEYEENHETLSKISSSTFKLPAELSCRLRALSDHLYNGRGFQIIRGIDPSEYPPKQSIILHAGVSAHIFPERGYVDINCERVIGHVVNVRQDVPGHRTVAPAFSESPLSFHTDHCEILSFYCKRLPAEGGRPILSSSWQVYNELAADRPEVLHTLAEPWVLDSLKDHSLQPPRCVPFLTRFHPGNNPPILFRFSRYPVLGWQRKRSAQLPPPTRAQLEALDAVQFVAQKNAMTVPVREGDMLFINDMAVFHAREGYDAGGQNTRHLLKMYLRDPEQGWTVPQSLLEEFGENYTRQSDRSKGEIWDIHHELGLEELSLING